jgi:hypothetical protein
MSVQVLVIVVTSVVGVGLIVVVSAAFVVIVVVSRIAVTIILVIVLVSALMWLLHLLLHPFFGLLLRLVSFGLRFVTHWSLLRLPPADGVSVVEVLFFALLWWLFGVHLLDCAQFLQLEFITRKLLDKLRV